MTFLFIPPTSSWHLHGSRYERLTFPLSPLSQEGREAPTCGKLAEGGFSRIPCRYVTEGWLEDKMRD